MRYYSRGAAGVTYLVRRGTIMPNTATGMIEGDLFITFGDFGGIGVFDSDTIADPEERKIIEEVINTRAIKGLFGPEFYTDDEPYLAQKLKYGRSEVEHMVEEIRQAVLTEDNRR